ncbi:MAG: endonuclease/exonuclease/phosphatase family protein [Clostridia bacterium]|nr:endonuclease/exonuclease/phosphatase family protein [Clostridia bacterium]
MKKIFVLLICICLVFMLVSCGVKITPNEPYDMNGGVVMGDYKEINFTIASYNIKGGEATTHSVTKIKDNLEAKSVDIAGLQEVDHLSDRTGKKDFLSIFKNNSSLKNISYFPIELQGFGDSYGIATISKNKIERTHSFKLPYPYEYEKPRVEKRIITRSLITIDGVQIAFYNTHFSYEEVKMSNGISLRGAQFKYLLELLNSDPSPYKIVTGDFNVLSFNEFKQLREKGYNTVNNEQNTLNTYRGSDSSFRAIDNIIYSDRLEVLSCSMTEDECSDHNMLYAQFKTKYD